MGYAGSWDEWHDRWDGVIGVATYLKFFVLPPLMTAFAASRRGRSLPGWFLATFVFMRLASLGRDGPVRSRDSARALASA